METLGGEKGRNEKECGSVQLRIMKLRVMWELRVVWVSSYRSWRVDKPVPVLSG